MFGGEGRVPDDGAAAVALLGEEGGGAGAVQFGVDGAVGAGKGAAAVRVAVDEDGQLLQRHAPSVSPASDERHTPATSTPSHRGESARPPIVSRQEVEMPPGR